MCKTNLAGCHTQLEGAVEEPLAAGAPPCWVDVSTLLPSVLTPGVCGCVVVWVWVQACLRACICARVHECMFAVLWTADAPHCFSHTQCAKKEGFSQMGGMQLRLTCYSPTISNGSPFLRMQVT